MIYTVEWINGYSDPQKLAQEMNEKITQWQEQGMYVEVQSHMSSSHNSRSTMIPRYSACLIIRRPFTTA